MKAIVVHPYGGPEVLKFEESPDPVPGPGDVLVRVAAAGVNPIDYKRRAGLTKDFYPIHFPGLIGVDMAGTVIKVGPGVEGFSGSPQELAGEPDINTELSRARTDQPEKEEHVQNFRKVEEIVEPVKRRNSFRHGRKAGGQESDKHIDQ
jgi:hypothetical protein